MVLDMNIYERLLRFFMTEADFMLKKNAPVFAQDIIFTNFAD
jgi:hypothetical protein